MERADIILSQELELFVGATNAPDLKVAAGNHVVDPEVTLSSPEVAISSERETLSTSNFSVKSTLTFTRLKYGVVEYSLVNRALVCPVTQ